MYKINVITKKSGHLYTTFNDILVQYQWESQEGEQENSKQAGISNNE